MRIAIADLQLDILYIVTPGRVSYRAGEKIEVLSVRDIDRDSERISDIPEAA